MTKYIIRRESGVDIEITPERIKAAGISVESQIDTYGVPENRLEDIVLDILEVLSKPDEPSRPS